MDFQTKDMIGKSHTSPAKKNTHKKSMPNSQVLQMCAAAKHFKSSPYYYSIVQRKSENENTPDTKFDLPNIVLQKKEPNHTGIPDSLKEKMENASGLSFDDVRVHYNSDKPAQLQALAYTQGNQVYVGSGQEKHLGHELGHVVQQKQGIVKPTSTIRNLPLNDSTEFEKKADEIAQKALYSKKKSDKINNKPCSIKIVQRLEGLTVKEILKVKRLLSKKHLLASFDFSSQFKEAKNYAKQVTMDYSPRIGNHHLVLCVDKIRRFSVRKKKFTGTGMMGRVSEEAGPLLKNQQMLLNGSPPLFGTITTHSVIVHNLAAVKKREDLSKIMGQSAAKLTGIAGSEYLHIIGHQLGGKDAYNNLCAGSHALNTAMIPIENLVADLEKMGIRVNYSVSFYTKKLNNSATTFEWVYAVVMSIDLEHNGNKYSHIWNILEQDSAEGKYMINGQNLASIKSIAQDFYIKVFGKDR